MTTAVIISTYNAPDWLEKVLWGYACQSRRDFRIVIADDGSEPATRTRIDMMRDRTGLDITHHWHHAPDYQRQRILNIAITRTDADYLIFTDGDCIPRRDFIDTHLRLARPGCFLSGGYCKLPMALSRVLTADDITTGRCFWGRWLWRQGLRRGSALAKIAPGPRTARLLNRLTPTRPTWNNCNSSTWRSDILRVNGFDERMKYGGADRELGQRLAHAGLRPIQVRHVAICLHLDHARGYATRESIQGNLAIRRETRRLKLIETPHGIRQLDGEPQGA